MKTGAACSTLQFASTAAAAAADSAAFDRQTSPPHIVNTVSSRPRDAHSTENTELLRLLQKLNSSRLHDRSKAILSISVNCLHASAASTRVDSLPCVVLC